MAHFDIGEGEPSAPTPSPFREDDEVTELADSDGEDEESGGRRRRPSMTALALSVASRTAAVAGVAVGSAVGSALGTAVGSFVHSLTEAVTKPWRHPIVVEVTEADAVRRHREAQFPSLPSTRIPMLLDTASEEAPPSPQQVASPRQPTLLSSAPTADTGAEAGGEASQTEHEDPAAFSGATAGCASEEEAPSKSSAVAQEPLLQEAAAGEVADAEVVLEHTSVEEVAPVAAPEEAAPVPEEEEVLEAPVSTENQAAETPAEEVLEAPAPQEAAQPAAVPMEVEDVPAPPAATEAQDASQPSADAQTPLPQEAAMGEAADPEAGQATLATPAPTLKRSCLEDTEATSCFEGSLATTAKMPGRKKMRRSPALPAATGEERPDWLSSILGVDVPDEATQMSPQSIVPEVPEAVGFQAVGRHIEKIQKRMQLQPDHWCRAAHEWLVHVMLGGRLPNFRSVPDLRKTAPSWCQKQAADSAAEECEGDKAQPQQASSVVLPVQTAPAVHRPGSSLSPSMRKRSMGGSQRPSCKEARKQWSKLVLDQEAKVQSEEAQGPEPSCSTPAPAKETEAGPAPEPLASREAKDEAPPASPMPETPHQTPTAQPEALPQYPAMTPLPEAEMGMPPSPSACGTPAEVVFETPAAASPLILPRSEAETPVAPAALQELNKAKSRQDNASERSALRREVEQWKAMVEEKRKRDRLRQEEKMKEWTQIAKTAITNERQRLFRKEEQWKQWREGVEKVRREERQRWKRELQDVKEELERESKRRRAAEAELEQVRWCYGQAPHKASRSWSPVPAAV